MLLRGVIAGSFTFIVFFLVVSLTIVAWGVAVSFLAAIGVGLLTHAASLQFLRGRSRILRLG
jgi:ABC-type nickel/cobalt efflux system permease component RcnA